MMYSYPFFSFPHFRRFDARYSPASYPYLRRNSRDYSKYSNSEYDCGNNVSNSEYVRGDASSKYGKYNSYKYGSAGLRIDDSSNGQSYDNTVYTKNRMNSSIKQVNNASQDRECFPQVESSTKKKEKSSPKRTFSGFSFLNNFLHQEDRAQDEEFFDLFGLKLYNDDLLLIGLIFFLYKEDVKDEYLFFALVLLLLS